MSYQYDYTRELTQYTDDQQNAFFAWNINDPQRIDPQKNLVWLPYEIKYKVTDKSFIFYGGYEQDPTKVAILFDEELSEEEASLLDTVVSNHKDNVCTNWCVQKEDGTFVLNPDTEETQVFDSQENAQQVADALTNAIVKGVVVLQQN